jgi:hypothetical protein
VNDEQLEFLRALLMRVTHAVAQSPLTDTDDRAQIMALWFLFNQSVLKRGEDRS